MKRIFCLSVVTLAFAVVDGRTQGWGGQPPLKGPGCSGCAAAPVVVANEAPCCTTSPGLFARLRDRLRGSCSSCSSPCPPARPGLLQRIRDRVAERRAANACASPCP
jgi:hypothetical protein